MKIYRGLVDLISKPTKTKAFLITSGIASGIFIYSKVYQYKHDNHSLLGIIISAVPTIIILSLMGDVGETKKPEMVNSRKENTLPVIIDKPHRHNMYNNVKPVEHLPIMVESMEIIENDMELRRIRKRVYYQGGNYSD